MNISGWSVDGCGLLHDCDERDLSPHLSVVLGPNEAGKTTLLEFIRAMLFAPKPRELPPAPLKSQQHGGRLFLTGADGSGWTIHRDFGARRPTFRITAEDGRDGDQSDLDRLLGNCDRQVFRSIFAFTLTELNEITSLSHDEIEGKIFSTGIRGAGRSAAGAVKELGARQAKLLRASPSTKATLNDLAAEIKAIRARIDEARRRAAGYQAALDGEAACRAAVERWRAEIGRHRVDHARARLLIDLWPTWARRCEAEQAVASLPALPDLADDAETRLTACQSRIEAAAAALREANDALAVAQAQRRALLLDDGLERVASDVAELDRLRPVHDQHLLTLAKLDAELAAGQEALEERLRALGPDWSRERLIAFDCSIPRSAEIRAWNERLAQREAVVREADAARKQAIKHDSYAKVKLHEVQRELDALEAPLDLDVIARRERAAAAFQASWREAQAAGQRRETSQNRLNDLRRDQLASNQGLPDSIAHGLGALAVAGLAVAAWQAVAGGTLIAVVLALAALALIASTVIVRRRQAGRRDAAARLANEIAEVSASVEEHGRACDEQVRGMAAAAAVLGLPAEATSHQVAAAEAELKDQRSKLDRRVTVVDAVAARQNEVDAASQGLEAAEAEASDAAAQRAVELSAWETWKAGVGVPSALSPDDALAFFGGVQSARDALQALVGVEGNRAAVQREIASFERRVEAAIAAAGEGWRAEPGRSPLDQFGAVHAACAVQRENRKKAADLDGLIEGGAAHVAMKRQALVEAQAELEASFAAVGASDEAAFRRLLDQRAQQVERRREIAMAEQHLTERLGAGEATEAMRAELATGRLEEWTREADDAEQAIAGCERERDQAIEARRDAETARAAIETSADVAAAEVELASKVDAFKAALREWQIARLAETLIDETKAVFEAERQPKVLEDAGQWFARVTAGRYERLLQRDAGFEIEDAKRDKLSPERLSRGAREQLYLCLRLALAADFHRRDHQLPLIMDDVLVNFDPERARAMAELLCDVSMHQQILLFTCHPETVELLRGLQPDCRAIEMRRYGEPAYALDAALA